MSTVTFECHKETSCTVGENFRGKGHGAHHMRFFIIERVNTRDKHVFEARERYWRKLYYALYKGLNRLILDMLKYV